MAQISATEQRGMQQIDLTTLNLPQLSTLKQQLDQVTTFSAVHDENVSKFNIYF